MVILFTEGRCHMLNHVVLVGRIVQEPVVKETDSGKKVSNITIAVNRPYKNINGEYDTDFIPCTLWMGIAENTAEYCSKGDIVGVKGRVQSRTVEKDGKKETQVDIICEKITFLSSKPKDAKEEADEETDD